MQVGISTASLFMRKYNEEALPLLNELGVECAEVFLTSFSEYGYPFADTLKSVKGDLNVYSVHERKEGEPFYQFRTRFEYGVRAAAFQCASKGKSGCVRLARQGA